MISQDIHLAQSLLESGNLVAIPTETVYGLAANALDPEAISKIFLAKQRPRFNPLIVHTSSVERVGEYVAHFPDSARELAQKFWPGPLTLVLPRKKIIPDLVTAGLPNVGIRVPNHPLSLALLGKLDFPLAAPSANPSNYVSPTRAEHVEAQLGEQVSLILDGGPSEVGIESTIVSWESGQGVILRLGGLSVEALEEVAGTLLIHKKGSKQALAPGMLSKHYAPHTPLILLKNRGEVANYMKKHPDKEIGALVFQNYLDGIPPELQIILSPQGSMEEAARNIFAAIREIDQARVQLILAETFPEKGLGRALNDRLQRAAQKKS